MARIAVWGLAKSGTTGLWSNLAKSYPPRYLHFFEGTYLPSRYNKYFGGKHPDKNSGDVLSKQIIGPDFDWSNLTASDKVIWLVRDPRDRLISYILYRHYDHGYSDDNFVKNQLELLRKKEQDPDSVTLMDLESRLLLPQPTLDSAFFWGDHQKWGALTHLIEEGRVFIFKYEDFVSQNYNQLESFLGLKIKGHGKVPRQFQRVVRSKTYGFWDHWFTERDQQNYRPLFQPFLQHYDYQDEWSLTKDKKIDPQHCSQYVRSIVNKRREGDGLPPVAF